MVIRLFRPVTTVQLLGFGLRMGRKKFLSSLKSTQEMFPKDSMFDFYYEYGIDHSGTLKKGSVNGITPLDIG